MGQTSDVEASIYLGSAHNWYQIEKLTLTRDGSRYRISSVGVVEFSREGVANAGMIDVAKSAAPVQGAAAVVSGGSMADARGSGGAK